jgi:lipoprotein-releasing system permease protein
MMATVLVSAWRAVAKNADGTPMFDISVDPQLYLWAAIVATLTGLVAAVTPAIRAARLEPVEAIRG